MKVLHILSLEAWQKHLVMVSEFFLSYIDIFAFIYNFQILNNQQWQGPQISVLYIVYLMYFSRLRNTVHNEFIHKDFIGVGKLS